MYSFQVFSQTTIVKNEFENTDDTIVIRSNSSGDFKSATPTLMSDDSWGYTAYANNGYIYYTNDKFISPGTSLALEDWWTDTESLSFNQIDITSYTDVDFSIGYASNNLLSANDKLDLIYYIDGISTRVTLIQGGNGEVNFGSPSNNGTGEANTYTLNIPDTASNFKFELELITDNGGHEAIYIDDVFLTADSGTTSSSTTYCVPSNIGNWNTYYITNVDFENINNSTSGTGGAYTNYPTEIANVNAGSTVAGDVTVMLNNYNTTAKLFVWLDFNKNGDLEDSGEEFEFDVTGMNSVTVPISIDIPSSIASGNIKMRVALISDLRTSKLSCDINYASGEFEDYTVIAQNTSPTEEIQVSGNSNNIISGSTTTSSDNYTNFGVYDINSGAITKDYVIENVGSADLILQTPYVSTTGSTAFTVQTQPAQTTLTSGQSTTFTIAFDPDTIGSSSAVVSILSNDTDENPFTFAVEGEGAQTFLDTDGDGVADNIDLDDDNDGLPDLYEQTSCVTNPIANTTDVIFLFEDFGTGTDRGTIDGVAYCWEDGFGSCNSSPDLNDGEYTVYYQAANGDGTNQTPNGEVASWADQVWYPGLDHTPSDTNGRMAMFNAEDDPGVFYETTITGVTSSVDITYGFSAINLDRADLSNVNSRQKPSVLIEIIDPTGALITSTSTGLIPPTSNYTTGDWIDVSASFSSPYTQFTVRLTNESPGGLGNDLAIDDIFVKQTLCDLDSDGVEDAVDLDNDDDGIPNVVELQLPDTDKDATVNNDSGINTWVDINNNGLMDLYDHQDADGRNPGETGFTGSLGTPIDLTDPKYDNDGDGVPDYLDLDSDNDGIFDAVEYDNKGDIDIDGDGNGDGQDRQIYDTNGDAIANDTFDGDGILYIADGNDTDTDSADHGTSTYDTPLDSDSDGTPDYLDIDSNDASNNTTDGSDIDNLEIYAYLDADNDGIIDGATDTDGDGILDAFDTDNTVYGSPRDLSDSYTLFFDGRNDYVEDDNVLPNGNGTIMAWVKSEGNNSLNTSKSVAGQSNFYLVINSDNSVSLMLNGSAVLTSTDLITNGIWAHVAATTSATETALYVNGELQGTPLTTGSINADTSNFTIGKSSNIDSNYFHGELDEVRVFSEALGEKEVQRMVYQELNDFQSFNQGSIIPLDINVSNTFSSTLKRYFKMDIIKNDILDDATTLTIDVGSGARLYNIKDIYFQTAPLPYETTQPGDWSDKNTWLHGDVWDIADETTNKPWSIVHIKNSVETSVNHSTLGLIVDSGIELEINDNVELNNSWYLNLEGTIDLQGESQLIQTNESKLVATGVIERDQQGTENLYTYNYWSSPVHTSNPNADIDGDETYTVASILRDGEDANNPGSISFVGGYDGNNTTSPIQIADYWIWKFDDKSFDNYYAWEQTKSNGTLKAGEGYTMKGPGTGSVSTDKNYVFQGKPNNGTIALPITAGNASLVGNPYPSAIDAHAFINDNPHLDGTLYFWEHYGGNSHILKNYEGGYATYNYSGGVPTIAKATPDADVAQTGSSTKTPARYVPVGQGFFVKATSGGNVTFNNNQRIFETEASSTTSLFVRGTAKKTTTAATDSSLEDLRTKLRLNYNSPDGYTRQLLTTIDENATLQIDRGYDAPLIEDNEEDMFWTIGDNSFVIQGIDEASETTALPLSVKTQTAGEVVISLAELKYPTDGFELYLKDNLTQTYHDLLENSSYTTSVEEGITANRFEIVFAKPTNTLGISDNEITQDIISIYYDPSDAAIHITNPDNFQLKTSQVLIF
ncbi:internalin putative [Algibacter lectus]|uniref:Internalin putative n=1 Tax=Algibacter lectus TaxID=221126 RepID=A0A090V7A1_9FLAO|nr:internalin putative [Algibacter lectus]